MSTLANANDVVNQTWEAYKEIIRNSYLVLDHSLAEVTQELNRTYHFAVSKAQVEYRCKKWNFRKSLTKEEWSLLTPKIQKRKRNDKETEICIDGLPMNDRKVKKAMSRYGFSSVSAPAIQAPSPRTPEGITIRTPVAASANSTPDATTMSMSLMPMWIDYETVLVNSLPFTQFKNAFNTEELENAPAEENLLAVIPVDDIHAETVARFQIGSTLTDHSALFGYKIQALMPESFYFDNLGSPLTARRHCSQPAVKLLDLALFVASNKMISSTADISKKTYEWIGRCKGQKLLNSLLSIDGPTSEAFAEHIFSFAIDQGDVRTIKTLLNLGLDPNKTKYSSEWEQVPPLQRACEMRDLELVRMLVQAGAHVNSTSSEISSPLLYAVDHIDKYGYPRDRVDIELVNILLNAGASVNPSFGGSPLMEAAAACHLELVDILLAKGADPNFAEEDGGVTPLFEAVHSNGSESDIISIVKHLMQAGADVHACADYDWENNYSTVLADAVGTASIELIKLLLVHGAHPSESALYRAISDGADDIISLLLDTGSRVTPKMVERAAKDKDIEMLQSLIDHADDNTMETCRSAALTAAIWKGANHVVESLLRSGAVLRSGPDLEAAIEAAATRGDLSVLRLLLDGDSQHRASAITSLGSSLVSAIAKGHDKIAELLLEAGADVNTASSPMERTPLLEAIRQRNMHLSQKLLAAGAAINTMSTVGSNGYSVRITLSVLPAAVSWGSYPLVQALIHAGADVDAPESGADEAKTALTIAVEKRDPTMIQLLIEAGADINIPATERGGHTALVAAIRNNDLATTRQLLKLGADPDDSALIAAVARSPDLMQLLLTTKLARSQRFPQVYGIRAMQHAVGSSNTAIIEVLLKNGFSPNVIARPHRGETSETLHKRVDSCHYESPLGTAIRLDSSVDLDIVRMLLEGGADPNRTVSEAIYEDAAFTGLLAGIKRESSKVVEMLLDAGADVNLKAGAHVTRTPLQSAVEKGTMDITKLLLERGADVNAPPHQYQGATALQFAAIKGYLGIALLLLEYNANVDAPPARFDGRTALEGASEHGRIDMVQLLLSAGAQVLGSGSRQYQRARDFATENGHLAVRRLLERFHAQQQSDGFWNWDTFPDSTIAEGSNFGI